MHELLHVCMCIHQKLAWIFVKAKIVKAKTHNLKGSIIQAETMIKIFTSQIVWCTHIIKYKQMEVKGKRKNT